MRWSRSTVFGIMAVLATLSVLVMIFLRASLGVDFTDEAYYASMANRLAQGGTLFVDEFAVQQLGQMFVVPLVWLHRTLTGSSDGLILFLRWSYLAVAFALSLIPMFALRKDVGFPAALLIGLVGVVCVPFNIIAFSYNTLAMHLLSAGLFLGYWSRDFTSRRRTCAMLAVGFLFGGLLLAYPTLGVVMSMLVGTFFVAKRAWKDAGLVACGGCVLPLLVTTMLGITGLGNVRQALSFSTANAIPAAKVIEVWTTLWTWFDYRKPIIIGLLIVAILLRFAARRSRLWALPAIALLCLPLPLVRHSVWDSMLYVIGLTITAPFSMAFLWRQKTARDLFLLVWIPSAIGGYITALTSGNGTMNLAIGFFPGMLVAVALLVLLIRQGVASTSVESSDVLILDCVTSLCVPLIVVGTFLFFTYRAVYRDAEPSDLTTRVERGPFAGLYTVPDRAAFIEDMADCLNRVAESEDRVLFFYDFPAGYLLTDLHPASNCSWQLQVTNPQCLGHHRAIVHYWKDPSHQPTLMVQLTTNPMTNQPCTFNTDDEFVELLHDRFDLIVKRRDFAIFRRNTRITGDLALKSPF
jgi:hypothetical protein